ncbi:MAG TPA: hypothetical protein VE999_01680 [Gemmataceae bacterium]|nr:hypothetical protein [Bryobacteraceae bacterium]HZV03775.1 hypothetical protein [Gemmataceae bacterium]
MGDQAERVVLEAEDQVSPVVDKANAGLDSFEKKAESAHGKVIRITDQTRSSVQRLIASLEKQADVYGKSGVERLISQRDQLLQRYAKEPAAIDAITRSYEKMIAVEEKAAREAAMAKAAKEAEEALRKQSESIKSFGERVGQFIENPIQGAKGAIGSMLSTLGPFGVGVAAGAAALAGFGVAAFEAAKSLGQYGTAVKDAELRTGLTAKEVGQFGFAAKAVGQDISIVERLMRGLSQAADENSREGEKARATLQRMGVDLRNAAGEMKPTSEILIEISEGLNKLPEGLQRDAAAMELFKRVGIEAIPFMTELNENLRIAHEQGFGPTEDDVRRFQEYQREVAQLETKWDALVRKFKEGIVITVSWVGKGADWFLNNIGTAGDDERARREEEQARQEAEQVRSVGGYGASMSRSAHRREVADLERRAPGIMQNRDAIERQIADLRTRQQDLVGNFGWVQMLAPTEEEVGRMRQAADLQKQIEQLQHELDAAQQATHRMDLRAGQEESDRLRARFFGTHEGMEKAYSDAKKDVERYQKELFEPEKPLTKTEVLDLSGKLRTAQATEARWKSALDAEKNQSEQLKEFHREAEAFVKKGEESELDAIGKIYYQRDLLLKQAAQVKATEAEIAVIRRSADEQAEVVSKKAWEEFEKYDEKRRAERQKEMLGLFLPSKEQLKEWQDVFKAQERIEDIGVQAQREALRRHANVEARRAETPEEAYRVRVDLAIQLAEIEVARIQKEESAARRMELAAQAQKDLYTELAQAQDELDEKRAAAEQKRTEELQRQVDEIQKVSSGLLHTLFTKPGDFPKQLGSAIQEAVLKPVTEGFGGMIASALHPLIYGSDGQGGISGILHGAFGGPKQDPITVTTDNTAATIQNSRAIWLLTAVLSEYMGRNVPALSTQGGMAAPNVGVASPSGFLSQMLRNTGGLPRFAEGGVTSGPTIVGEAGPELVIPLDKLLDLRPTRRRPLVTPYDPAAMDAALGKATMGLFNVALPAGLSALGGPAGISVGDTIMSLLVGGVAAATPPRNDGVLLGVVPIGPPGSGISRSLAERDALAWPGGIFEREEDIVKSGLWAVNPKTGNIRLSGFSPSGHAEPHAVWFERIGLPSIGREFDRVIRGRAYITSDGAINLVDETWGGGLTDDIYRKVQRAIVQRYNPGVREASVRGPRDLIYIRRNEPSWFNLKGGRDLWNMTYEQHVAAGRKGGLKSQALRRLDPRDPELDEFGNYIGPPVDVPETAHQASARIDEVAPHLKDIDWGRKSGQITRWVTVGGEKMSLLQAGKRLGISSLALEQRLGALYPNREDWAALDLLEVTKDWKVTTHKAFRLPSHDEGGTIASTGLAVVHKGEAVIPQADTLKRSIDALTGAMYGNAGMIRWLISAMFSGRTAGYPLAIPGVGTVSVPLFGGGSSSTAANPPVSWSGGTASASPVGGYTPAPWAGAGGYTPAPWAGAGSLPQSELDRIEKMVSGGKGQGVNSLFSKGGFSQALSNLKGAVWNEDAWNAYPWTTGGVIAGGIEGVASSPAAGVAGLTLATRGLISNAGSWTGAIQGAAGGALIGNQIGGPLGAAAGASFGFEIGALEKLFGVKSLNQTAHDDIKAIYGVDIPTNSGTIKQIVEIAKSQFGGSISVAVRSPSVRQLVMLYSEATGQKMPLSAATPYAGSLVEQGGNLYQQASFQNNAWHMYQSSLPTLGGIAGSPYPTQAGPNTMAGAGPTYVSLNISGAAVAPFMTGQFVTPEFVTDQAMAAQYASYGRTQQSANMQVPGLTVA